MKLADALVGIVALIVGVFLFVGGITLLSGMLMYGLITALYTVGG